MFGNKKIFNTIASFCFLVYFILDLVQLKPTVRKTDVFRISPIIFIHIGDDPEFFPDYMYFAVRQAAVWNPFSAIYVIIPRIHEHRPVILDLVRDCGSLLQLWFIEDIPLTIIHARFERETTHETSGFRSGFWRFTSERLFVLLDAMVMLGLNESIHLENDNLLYVQIDSILPTLRREYPGLAVEPHGSLLCTAGFLYVRNVSVLETLMKYMIDSPNDMQSLAKFQVQEGNLSIGLLPVIAPLDCVGADERFFSNFNSFRGLFDAAPHGQYIGGVDPRNKIGGPGYVNMETGTPYRVDDFEYEWRFDSSTKLGRFYIHRFVEVSKSAGCNASAGVITEWYPLFQLHIHSKDLHKFSSFSLRQKISI
jgi:hypothetical protein